MMVPVLWPDTGLPATWWRCLAGLFNGAVDETGEDDMVARCGWRRLLSSRSDPS
ncbi:MAG: hypothetical protein U5K27_02160 [Desulfotignum sp.]|nr:hypothetical protein [Desulfotignum sp.]